MMLGLTAWFPATMCSIAGYVAHLFRQGYASSTIHSALSAISFFHKVLDKSDPINSFFIRKLLMGVTKSKPSYDIRTPISLSMLKKLILVVPSCTEDNYAAVLLKSDNAVIGLFCTVTSIWTGGQKPTYKHKGGLLTCPFLATTTVMPTDCSIKIPGNEVRVKCENFGLDILCGFFSLFHK